jgi:NAD(P)H-flavin reductase
MPLFGQHYQVTSPDGIIRQYTACMVITPDIYSSFIEKNGQ